MQTFDHSKTNDKKNSRRRRKSSPWSLRQIRSPPAGPSRGLWSTRPDPFAGNKISLISRVSTLSVYMKGRKEKRRNIDRFVRLEKQKGKNTKNEN